MGTFQDPLWFASRNPNIHSARAGGPTAGHQGSPCSFLRHCRWEEETCSCFCFPSGAPILI